jgi:sugar lactone lactonase YvrE
MRLNASTFAAPFSDMGLTSVEDTRTRKMTYSLPRDFQLRFEDLQVVARGLTRPECILALSSGRLITANGKGGYSVVEADGSVDHVIARTDGTRRYLPNGIALGEDGRVLFADLGAERGGIFTLFPSGELQPLIEAIQGETLPPSNYLVNDRDGRLWLSVSTRKSPRTLAWNHQVADGFIVVIDERGARIVADGIGYTNEIAFSPDGRWLYVNETYNQRTRRYPVIAGSALGQPEILAEFTGADFPDGLTFDQEGGAWITCIASNRLLVLRPDGELQTVLEDTDTEYAAMLAERLQSQSLTQEDMSTAGKSRLGNISSLAFGGPDLRTAYLGCLLDDCIRSFKSPLPGLAPVHWRRELVAA